MGDVRGLRDVRQMWEFGRERQRVEVVMRKVRGAGGELKGCRR